MQNYQRVMRFEHCNYLWRDNCSLLHNAVLKRVAEKWLAAPPDFAAPPPKQRPNGWLTTFLPLSTLPRAISVELES